MPFAALAASRLGRPLACAYPRPIGSNEPILYASPPPGAEILLIDDATGIGLTKLPIVRFLRSEGHRVELLSLQEQGRALVPTYGELGVSHRAVYNCRHVLDVAAELGLITSGLANTCHAWLVDADAWDHDVGEKRFLADCAGSAVFTMTREQLLETLEL